MSTPQQRPKPVRELTCLYEPCSKTYFSNHYGSRYCSVECGGLARRKPRETRTCPRPGCGKQFEVIVGGSRRHRSKFCSKECGDRNRALEPRRCDYEPCSKIYQPERSESRFCSRLCGRRGSARPPAREKKPETCSRGHEWKPETTRTSERVSPNGKVHVRRDCTICDEITRPEAAVRARDVARNRRPRGERSTLPPVKPARAIPAAPAQPPRPPWRPEGWPPVPDSRPRPPIRTNRLRRQEAVA